MKRKQRSSANRKSKTLAFDGAPNRTNKRPRTHRTAVEVQEDNYIAYLERKLGYGGGKGKQIGDGLDDLFDFASSLYASVDPDDRAEDKNRAEDEDEENEDEAYDEWDGIQAALEDAEPEPTAEHKPPPISSTPTASTYVPPALREKQQSVQSEEVLKLTRQLKGLINRMSEQNLDTILESVEEIYRNHRRNDVTTTITSLAIDAIASHSSLLDSFVVLYAAFIASLHKLVGIEFCAHFVQSTVLLYEKYYAEANTSYNSEAAATEQKREEDERGKECTNLMVLLSELYNFQVISAVLVYDLIRALLDGNMTEFKVELLLKITRNSGQQLHQDDPSALKDIIQNVQNKVAGNEATLSSRTRFMIEILNNLKNNKSKRNITQNQGGEAVERMKKFLSNLGRKRHLASNEPLRVTLEDLHSAETKGKWWLVGAAWAGDPLAERQNVAKDKTSQREEKPIENSLIQLSRKQGMNTDIRRSIFVVLMSSDDYIDACERLSQLNLTEVQQREIVRVLLHCCGNEKTYNPYYALIGQHLCRSSHSYKITVQFCLWDFLRDLGETTVGGAEVVKNAKDDTIGFNISSTSKKRLRNIANAYGWWIAKDSVTLTILKAIDFTTLKPQTTGFLKEVLIQIYLNSQTSTPIISTSVTGPETWNKIAIEEIFGKATRAEALAMGLVYFMNQAFKRIDGEEEFVAFVKWATSLAKDTLRTGLDAIPML